MHAGDGLLEYFVVVVILLDIEVELVNSVLFLP